jgi:hypothetical protein
VYGKPARWRFKEGYMEEFAYKELIDEIQSLNERIRVLEDALKWALDNVTDEYANDVTEYYQKLKWASNTLEVKP